MSNIEMSEASDMLSTNQDEYADYRLKNVLESGPLIVVLPAVFNFLMLFADVSIIHAQTARNIILFLRVLYSVILLFFLFRIKKIRSFQVFCRTVTFFEVVSVGIFLYVFRQYPNPDFMIQTLGVITIVLIVFLIPNTWKNIIIVVGATELSFLIFAKLWVSDLDPMHFWAGAVYITIVAMLCAFFAWNTQKAQSSEFIARQELQRQSSTDYLTQATTRFKLEEEADRWMVFCRKQGIPLSLVFVDVDNLKPVNDRYGHLAGDKVLSEIVFRIRAVLQESDIVARWGGDEFILLLPDADLKKAAGLSESIRQSIEQKPLIESITATCSFGVVSMNKKSTFETMIREADDLMYKSKRLGKNRIEHAHLAGS